MNFLKRILKNQSGISLPIVIVITGVALSSIGYIALNLLPKLQDSKKKAEKVVDYRIFMGSLNDYVVHGVRERWCIPVMGTSGEWVLSNLLLSNDCAAAVPMETQVTFAGNLERILWGSETIGNAGIGNSILGLNARNVTAGSAAAITAEQITAPIDSVTDYPTLKFRVTEQILNGMNDTHPLFAISKEVKSCIEYVDIKLERTNSSPTNPSVGDEVRLRVTIELNLQDLKLSCLSLNTVKSVTYYTFYPRRLHTYSLIKYGDLDAVQYHEYHSPVYVAGNLLLPTSVANKPKSSIFYDTLTLGTFNAGGPVTPTSFYAGVVRNGTDNYTFEDRGNPYTGKQDNYDTMRGFLGGIRLDGVEDKGFVTLFQWDNTNDSDVANLERCIEENKVLTTQSASSGTLLAYSNHSKTLTSGDADTIQFKLGFTKLNRFKPTIFAPAVGLTPAQKFKIDVPPPPAQTQSIGELTFKADDDNIYSATMGAGASVNIKIDLVKYDITAPIIDTMVAGLNGITADPAYKNIIPNTHILKTSLDNQIDDYEDAAEDFIEKCVDNDAEPLHCLQVTVVSTCLTGCNTSKYNKFVEKRDALVAKLNAIKTQISLGEPKMTFSLEDVLNGASKLIINQKIFKVVFTPQWHYFYDIVGHTFPSPTLKFNGYNYGPDILTTEMFLKKDSDTPLELRDQIDNDDHNFSSASGWRNTVNNVHISSSSDEPKELLKITCPDGMGLADWDIDMSPSSNFAWNYTDNSPGVSVDTSEHGNIQQALEFKEDGEMLGHRSGTSDVLTLSVVENCIIKNDRKHVYGFYVCKNLRIEGGRSLPLHMIGTFIVKNLANEELAQPVHWHSIWSPVARELVLTELNKPPGRPSCTADLATKTMLEVIQVPGLDTQIKACSSQDLINNGPNNFTWTTVDPDIGISDTYPEMTSEKVKRFQRWIVREDSRKDEIR